MANVKVSSVLTEGMVKFDLVVLNEAKEALRTGVRSLGGYSNQKVWHPDSNDNLNSILYILVYSHRFTVAHGF